MAFPTETVYGLGADATNEQAVKQVYLAKGRPSDNPLIVHVASLAMVEQYAAEIPAKARALMKEFWPGSLTIILKIKPNTLSKAVTGGLDTVAFRFPANQATLDLIKQAGVPLVGPSANTSGKPSPTTANHVFHDLNGKIAGILDDGPTRVGVESTVLDLSTAQPVILRPGAVTKAAIERVIGSIELNHHKVKQDEIPKAPGMKYKHYAPKAELTLVEPGTDWEAAETAREAAMIAKVRQLALEAAGEGRRVGIICTDESRACYEDVPGAMLQSIGSRRSQSSVAHNLYQVLREFDDLGAECIFSESFPKDHLGQAIMNRLSKAAGYHIIKA